MCNFDYMDTVNYTPEGSRTFLAVRLVRLGDINVKAVSGLISNCKKKRDTDQIHKDRLRVFLVGIMNLFKSERILFMVPTIKIKDVKKVAKKFEARERQCRDIP